MNIKLYSMKILFLLIIFLATIILITLMYYMLRNEYRIMNKTTSYEKNLYKNNIILWWTPFIKNFEYTRLCNKEIMCFFTGNRTYQTQANLKAFLFYGSNMVASDMPVPRNSKQLWALYHEESPKNVPYLMYNSALNIFNVTATFSMHSDFPLTLQYLDNINSITDKTYMLSIKEKNELQINEDLAPIIYIQSICDTMSGRDQYVMELMEFIKIDSYGKCLHNKDIPKNTLSGLDYLNTINTYEFKKFVSRYKFIIAYENAVCDDYVTEKFWRSINIGVVPIYFGAPNIEEWLPNKNSAIIIKNFQSPRDLAAYINRLNTNDAEYEEFLQHKNKMKNPITNDKLLKEVQQRPYSTTDDIIHSFECFICERSVYGYSSDITYRHRKPYTFNINLMVPKLKNIIINSEWKTIMEQGKCEADVLQYFVEQNHTYNNKLYFEEIERRYLTNQCKI